jgi:hypothetical protein
LVTPHDVAGYENQDYIIKEQKFQGPFVNAKMLEGLCVKRQG